MTKDRFQAEVIKLHEDYTNVLKISSKQFTVIEARAKSHEPFDPKLAELERAVYLAYKGACIDLISYIETKTECKNG